MKQKLAFKLGFSLFLVTVMVVGLASSSAAMLQARPDTGWDHCPTPVCPLNMSGYTQIDNCTSSPGACITECEVWKNNANGSECKQFCVSQ